MCHALVSYDIDELLRGHRRPKTHQVSILKRVLLFERVYGVVRFVLSVVKKRSGHTREMERNRLVRENA